MVGSIYLIMVSDNLAVVSDQTNDQLSRQDVIIRHQLKPHFATLAQCQSLAELHQHPLYQQLRAEIEPVCQGKEYRNGFVPPPAAKPFYRAVAWNVERGICFEPILKELQTHPVLKEADILLLTETDVGMARSKNRNIARELALALNMNYYFLPAYINLCKGSGMEVDFDGENDMALHGNAILSRYPLKDLQRIPLQNAKDKMKGREKRIGNQNVVAATIEFPQKSVKAVCIHLDALSTQTQRQNQMISILERLQASPDMPVLLGGDWNTSTYNSSGPFYAICGFWYRIFMGVGNVIKNHYPYPDRYFEKGLFQALKKAGFEYEQSNELGAGTNHYATDDFKKYKILSDWVPQWCFAFIVWALRPYGGKCSLKLDWFASRNLKLVGPNDQLTHNGVSATKPKVIMGLRSDGNELSDHDPIVVDFVL